MNQFARKVMFALVFAAFLFVSAVSFSRIELNASRPSILLLLDGVENDPEPEFAYPAPVMHLGGVEDDPEPEFAYPAPVMHLGVEDDPEPEFAYPVKAVTL